MIRCRNCGAEYDNNEDRCPYCGADNHAFSVKKHEGRVKRLNNERFFWKNLPEWAAGKGRKLTVYFFIALVIISIVGAGITYSVSVIKQKQEYRIKRESAKELEALYKEADYQGIYEYMDGFEYRYSSEFDKYYIVYRLQQYVEYALNVSTDNDEGYRRWIIENNKKDAFYDISYMVDIFYECMESEDNLYMYGEEAAIEYYRDYAYSYIYDAYGIDKEEVCRIIAYEGGLIPYNKKNIEDSLSEKAFSVLADKFGLR